MSILLALCLLLVMICLIMALNAFTRLDKLRLQNDLMQKELSQLRQDYQLLQSRFGPSGAPPPEEPAAPGDTPSPEAVLKEQLEQFQNILEACRQQSGSFPSSLSGLASFANRYGYQKTVENPYTHARNPLVSEDVCLDITHDLIDEGVPEYAGRLLFQAHLGPRDQATGYFLTALDQRGMLLKREDGEALTLSHQS